MNLKASHSAIFSPGSEAGRSPCGGRESKALPESGQAPVPVSRFRARASVRGTPTSAIFGPLFTTSSPSADLQRCLESRLRARMDVNGSPEFVLTWKTWDMPAGEPICALRASERRIADSGCTGWPTPTSPVVTDGHEAGNNRFVTKTMKLVGWTTPPVQDSANNAGPSQFKRNTAPLNVQAALAAWPTPKTPTGGAQEVRTTPGGGIRKLEDVASLAAWPTPNAMEGGQTSRGGKRKGEPLMGGLVGWATPRAEDAESAGMRHSRGVADTLTAQAGQGTTSSRAEMGKRGVLRPGHSRWLMGYPAAWDSCGATAMQSFRKMRKSL